jgi:hypothetical protein
VWLPNKSHVLFFNKQVLLSLSRTWLPFWNREKNLGTCCDKRQEPYAQVGRNEWGRGHRWEVQRSRANSWNVDWEAQFQWRWLFRSLGLFLLLSQKDISCCIFIMPFKPLSLFLLSGHLPTHSQLQPNSSPFPSMVSMIWLLFHCSWGPQKICAHF